MSRSIARSLPADCLVLCAVARLPAAAAQAPRDATPPTPGSARSTPRNGPGGSRSWRGAATSPARQERATTSRASTPRRSRRGSPTGRARSRRSTAFRSTELSPEEQVNAQVFRTSIRALANDVRFKTYEAPFNSDTFFWTEFTPRQGFATADAYRDYLGRLRDVPRYFDEQIANMRAGLARGFTVPRVSVVGRDKTIEPYVKGDTTNPLYAPFAQMPRDDPRGRAGGDARRGAQR